MIWWDRIIGVSSGGHNVALIPPPVHLQAITEFIQQLTSIPSVKSERAIATCVSEKLAALRFEPHLIGDPEHPSVICHHQAATAKKTIWLQSNLDTAPVGDRSQWQHDPFAGTIVGDAARWFISHSDRQLVR